jgi:hypothetical protein
MKLSLIAIFFFALSFSPALAAHHQAEHKAISTIPKITASSVNQAAPRHKRRRSVAHRKSRGAPRPAPFFTWRN